MREILFRGKTKNSKNWVYGDLVRLKDGDKTQTCIYGFGEVVPESVGQYIGQTDKNGTKIFEGSIVTNAKGDIYEVLFDSDELFFTLKCGSILTGFEHYYSSELEVIGNIHDNPELLEGDKL